MSNIALFGITGLIGSTTAPLLLKYFDQVVAPTRREIKFQNSQIKTPVVDFNNLALHSAEFRNTDTFVYCLGTTKKKAGSFAEFRNIEWSLATNVTNLAKSIGLTRFVLLSAKGASADSWIPYSKVKGQIERLVIDADFPKTVIAKPSLLVGERNESRTLEDLSIKATKPILKPLQKYLPKHAPIQALQLAEALAEMSHMNLKKRLSYFENDQLIEIAGNLRQNVIDVSQ